MPNELTAIRGGNAPIHAFTKKCFVLQKLQGGIFHELFSVGAAVTGDLREFRFLFWRKVYFHAPKTQR